MKYNIELTDEQLKEIMAQQIKAKEIKPEYDFSEFVGRYNDVLCIFGEKMLKSIPWDGAISIDYESRSKFKYDDKLSYTECKLSELEYWDVFIAQGDSISLHNFHIYMGYCSNTRYRYQYLTQVGGVEYIEWDWINDDSEVIKINRD